MARTIVMPDTSRLRRQPCARFDFCARATHARQLLQHTSRAWPNRARSRHIRVESQLASQLACSCRQAALAANMTSSRLEWRAQRVVGHARAQELCALTSLITSLVALLAATCAAPRLSLAQGTGASVVTEVATPQDWASAISRGDKHVHITAHLNLAEADVSVKSVFAPGAKLETLTVRTLTTM